MRLGDSELCKPASSFSRDLDQNGYGNALGTRAIGDVPLENVSLEIVLVCSHHQVS
jgi:hypothetical protein